MEYVHQYNQYSAFGKISDTHAVIGLQMTITVTAYQTQKKIIIRLSEESNISFFCTFGMVYVGI
jgi:hypothetical protein